MSNSSVSSRKPPLPNSVKNYTLIEKIGAGSYSSVFRGLKNDDKQVVAIKCIEKSKLSPSGLENIITEITVMKLLHCKFTIEMKDFLWDDRFIYIILEYCDGGDLSKFIKRRKKLPERIFKNFMQQLALGLKFLRSHDVSHLDLKPQNLLLKREPQLILKIADFGFAQFLSNDTHRTSIRGSPLYMAPEMLLRNKYDAKADLWSVGVIAYECLFGKPPFGFDSCQELLNALKAQLPIQIPEGCVSDECHDLLTRLLVFDPGKRVDYDDFFNHAFLDLEHYPSEESYRKAVHIVHEAVSLDSQKNYEEAFSKYCQALLYLNPYAHSLPEGERKKSCLLKIEEYTKRAEEIKVSLWPTIRNKANLNNDSVGNSLESDDNMKSIASLCASTPSIASAVEIGFSAQMYLAEGDYEMAMRKYEASLGLLIPLLSTEPSGVRKELLSKQVQKWLTQAESIKALLSTRTLQTKESLILENQDSCNIQ